MENQKTAIIINPKAGGGLCWDRWERLRGQCAPLIDGIPEYVTSRSGEAAELAQKLLGEGTERFVVVGGDGTIHEVVNGMMKGKEGMPTKSTPILGMMMLGTGRDFARTWKIPRGYEPMLEVALRGSASSCDVGEVELHEKDGSKAIHYFINGLSCGCSSEVIEKVNQSEKRWGSWQYTIIGLRSLIRHPGQKIVAEWRGGRFEGVVSNIFVANGKYCGGGMCWASTADPSDGLLDLVIIESKLKMKILAQGWRIYNGSLHAFPGVQTIKTKEVRISSPDSLSVEMDGEQPGLLPMTCRLIPAAIRIAHP